MLLSLDTLFPSFFVAVDNEENNFFLKEQDVTKFGKGVV